MKRYKYMMLVLLLILLVTTESFSQCPMCRMTAESNLRNGGTSGAGLNAGILYMLVVPYLLVGGIAYWWWKNRKKVEVDGQEGEWGDNSQWN